MQVNVQTLSREEKRKIYQKTYQQRPEVKERMKLSVKAYYERNKGRRKEQMKAASKRYYENNKETLKAVYNKHYQDNKEKYKAAQKEWYKNNKQTRISYNTEYKKKRRKIDPIYRLQDNIRTRLRRAIKNSEGKKENTFNDLLGCTIEEAKRHIEKQWLPGMNWENYSYKGWHLDHIKPVNTFDLTDPEQQKQCFHYTNLRPLWAKDNMTRPRNGLDIC